MLRFLSQFTVVSLAARTQVRTSSCQDAPELECQQIAASDLVFDCRLVGPSDGTPVMLLHGFPEFSRHWIPMMSRWANDHSNIRAVACNLRGYSEGASPNDVSQYDYKILRDDVWALADAVGFTTFHLVGHDHGSLLGYFTATSETAESRLLSYTGISVAHPDATSEAITGEDMPQTIATQYLNQFAEVDSGKALWPVFGGIHGPFKTQQAAQTALWWYWGSVGKYFTRPPVVDDATFYSFDPPTFAVSARAAIPLEERPAKLTPPMGKSRVRTLFVCGSDDAVLLCTNPYAKDDSFYAKGFNYTAFPCGHNLFAVGGDQGCTDQATVDAVIDTITSWVSS